MSNKDRKTPLYAEFWVPNYEEKTIRLEELGAELKEYFIRQEFVIDLHDMEIADVRIGGMLEEIYVLVRVWFLKEFADALLDPGEAKKVSDAHLHLKKIMRL